MKTSVLAFLMFCAALNLQAQISVSYPDGKKQAYALGETLHVRVLLKSLPETCLDGMKQSKVFASALNIKDQTPWKLISKGQFQKDLTLEIIPSKKKTARLTILRKVDKENLFHQETFPILTN